MRALLLYKKQRKSQVDFFIFLFENHSFLPGIVIYQNYDWKKEVSALPFAPYLVVLIFCAQFLAYFIKGLVGFGNPLISGPLLSMGLDNILITPGTLVLDCPVNAYITWKNRRSVRWRRILPLLVCNMAGVIPGTLLLRVSMPWVIKAALGVVVIALGLEMATRSRRKAATNLPQWFRYPVAFFSGVCAALFGINMFLTAYLQRTAKDYSEFKGSICCLFFGENLFRFFVYLFGGLLTRQVWLFIAVSAPAALLAMVLAGLLSPRLEEGKLQKAAIALFLLGGVSILIKSLLLRA